MAQVLASYEIWNRQGADARPQPLARRSAGAACAAGLEGPAHQDPLHDAALRAAADIRCLLPRGRSALPKAYLRYLTNSLRHAFDLPGVPIRFKLRKGDNPFAQSD